MSTGFSVYIRRPSSRTVANLLLIECLSKTRLKILNVMWHCRVSTDPQGRWNTVIVEMNTIQEILCILTYRVTTCLENLEMSGNLKHVREMSGIMLTVREESGKNYCQEKLAQLGGEGQMKKFSRLANARHNPPWTKQLIFTVTLLKQCTGTYTGWAKLNEATVHFCL